MNAGTGGLDKVNLLRRPHTASLLKEEEEDGFS